MYDSVQESTGIRGVLRQCNSCSTFCQTKDGLTEELCKNIVGICKKKIQFSLKIEPPERLASEGGGGVHYD